MVLDFEHFSMPKSEGRRDVYGSCGGVMFCHVFFIEFFLRMLMEYTVWILLDLPSGSQTWPARTFGR